MPCKDRSAEHKKYYAKHREKVIAKTTAYALANPEIRNAITARYRAKHPDHSLKWRHKNLERSQVYRAAYAKRNATKIRVRVSERRAKKLKATPPWLTSEHRAEITQLYTQARARGLVVDHVVPLKGRHVSGLHVPWNLQLLTAFDNKKKANKHVG